MVDEDVDDDKEDGDDDDDDDVEPGNVLHVIDLQSGDILQRVRVDLQGGAVSAILVDGDEIYIVGYVTSKVVVLQLAGSEA